MASLTSRMLRAAKLDTKLYEEVEADKGAMGQATLVVVLSSVCAGLAYLGQSGVGRIVLMIISALVSWYIWAFITYVIGTRLLPQSQTRATYGQLLRTIGFSSSPGVIRIVGIIPGLTQPLFFAANIWMLVAMVIAVRQALDYTSTWRAVGVCVIGWVVQLCAITVLAMFFLNAGGSPA